VLAAKPLFVLALARPQVDRRFPNLWSARSPQRIGLPPLSARSSQHMVEHVVGAIPEASSQWIVDRAQGSPFYLQELLRVVVEGGQVGDDSKLPDTVLGMVQARLDSFGPEAKRVLRAASVFGESFSAAGVKALLDDSGRRDVNHWLDILEAQEVVFCRRNRERRDYAFRHALIRQAAYDLLPPDARRVGHLLAGRFLEQTGEPDGSVLADHFERAGDNPAAVRWLVLAAQQALDANDVSEAVARVDRAVRLGAEGEELCQLKLTEARARRWTGEYAEAEQAAKDALRTKDERRKLLALAALFDGLGPQAKYDQIANQYPVAQPEQEELLNIWLDAMETGAAYLSVGIAPSYCDQMLALFAKHEARLDPIMLARRDSFQARAARTRGDHVEVVVCLRRAVSRFRDVGLQFDAHIALGNVANSLCEIGQLENAVDDIRQVVDFGLKADLKHVQAGSLALLALLLACLGTFDEARTQGKRAQALARDQGDRRFQGFAEVSLSITEFLAGEYRAAEQYALAGSATWDAVPLARPFAVALLARALAAEGRATEALAHAREAHAQLEKMGSVDDGEATIRLALAECLLAAGDRDAAREATTKAAAWLRDRADKIDHAPYRESFLSRIPEHRRILDLAREFGV
jgi:eukaryotic-like serine/threonine-protein kinase